MAPLQNEIAPKSFNSRTKSKTKSETQSSKNAPKRPRNSLSPVQPPKSFSPAVLHSFAPAISNMISSTISNFFAQRDSAGMAMLRLIVWGTVPKESFKAIS